MVDIDVCTCVIQQVTWTASAGMLAASDERSKHDMIFSRSANPAMLRLFSGFTFCRPKTTTITYQFPATRFKQQCKQTLCHGKNSHSAQQHRLQSTPNTANKLVSYQR